MRTREQEPGQKCKESSIGWDASSIQTPVDEPRPGVPLPDRTRGDSTTPSASDTLFSVVPSWRQRARFKPACRLRRRGTADAQVAERARRLRMLRRCRAGLVSRPTGRRTRQCLA